MPSKRKKRNPFPRGYKSPFRHFLMPLRNVHRLDQVREVYALIEIEILKPGPSGIRVGTKTIVPLPLPQGTAREIRREFFLANGKVDNDAVEGWFNQSPLALYSTLVRVLGVYFLKSQQARRIVARQQARKGGGFKSQKARKRKRR